MTAKRILVIEDDPINRKVLHDYLVAHGFDVVTASDGVAGVEAAANEKPDLVLCDVLLPRKSGFEVCFDIKRTERGNTTPVVLMSAVCKDVQSETYASKHLRAESYLMKPFAMSEMLERIKALLS